MVAAGNMDQDPEAIAQGAVQSGDIMESTMRVKQAVLSRIQSLRWDGSAGDGLRTNGEHIDIQLQRAVDILLNKQEALNFTHNTTVTANADATTLFHAVNPGAGTTVST